MLSKNEVKYIQSLYSKKQRNEHNLFIVEGKKMVDELLLSDYVVEQIYATKDWQNSFEKTTIIDEDELIRISNLQTPNQVLAIVKMKTATQNFTVKNKINLVLDNIQDPGNFGTIIRIADWFGIENIICSNNCVELYNPKVIQSTMGSFFRVNIIYKNLIDFLPKSNLPIYGAMLDGIDLKKISKPKEAFIVIGNEGNGISNEVAALINYKISISKFGGAESLNAAIATGIIAWSFIDE
jgi:TrmH family RNA methyltransferase